MQNKLISNQKNCFTFALTYTPAELKECCGDRPSSGQVETLIRGDIEQVLAQQKRRSAVPPQIQFDAETGTATVTVDCLPELEPGQYRGLRMDCSRAEFSGLGSEEEQQVLLLDRLVEIADFDLPAGMYEKDVPALATALRQQSKYAAMARGELASFNMEMAWHLQDDPFEAEAVQQIKRDLVVDALIRAEQPEVTAREMEEEFQAIADRQEMPLEDVKQFFGQDLSALRQDVMVRKVLQTVWDNAVFRN